MRLVYEKTVPIRDGQCPIYLFCVFRDEGLLLDYFIYYYKSMGVTHFVMIDNMSVDNGRERLMAVQDCNMMIFEALGSYREADYGVQWINSLMLEVGREQICIVVDVDELLVFDTDRYSSLGMLIESMESSGSNVLAANLLDMYPKQTNNYYIAGVDFREHSQYFDAINQDYYIQFGKIYGNFIGRGGGMRKRVFDVAPCLHKFPLFKYNFYPLSLAPGYHLFVKNRETVTWSENIVLHKETSVLLHFKFLKPRIHEFITARIENNQDWAESVEYQAYAAKLDKGGAIMFYDPSYSRKLESNEDLRPFFCDGPETEAKQHSHWLPPKRKDDPYYNDLWHRSIQNYDSALYQPDLIYDLGMHNAQDTRFYLDKRFRVVSLEANPAFVEAAHLEHEAFVEAERLVIVNRALWHNSGKTIPFYLNPIQDDWSSAFKDWAEKGGHASEEIRVDTITLSQMFDTYGVPYYLKCDLGGAVELFVQQLLADPRRPAFVSIEAASLGALAVLFAAGYDLVQIVNQAFNSSVTPPSPAQEGMFVPARFNGLTSGLFGRELPHAAWQSFEDAARDYLAFRELQKHNSPLVHGWMDFHVASRTTLKQLGVI